MYTRFFFTQNCLKYKIQVVNVTTVMNTNLPETLEDHNNTYSVVYSLLVQTFERHQTCLFQKSYYIGTFFDLKLQTRQNIERPTKFQTEFTEKMFWFLLLLRVCFTKIPKQIEIWRHFH